MSIIQGTGRGVARRFYDFPIEQSLRFDGSSYLSRTPSTAGNRKTWTWSGWVKRSSLTANNPVIFSADNGNASWTAFQFTQSDGTIQITTFAGTSPGVYSNASFRDLSAWYHIVVAMDTAQVTAANRVKLYVNGVEQTFSNTNYPANSDTKVNGIFDHYIGFTTNQNYNGYLANIQFIDGQALDASYFGEISQDIWVPKTFDGTSSTGGSTVSTDYGTNGFLLDFSSISGTTINDTAPIDTNHSSANNWTATGF